MTHGIYANRRKTTLPALTTHTEMRGFAAIMKAAFIEPFREQLNRQVFWSAHLEPDPWDEAVKWIEQHEAAKAEWPWPARS